MAEPLSDRYQIAIDAIDAANAADPNELVRDGVAHPKELLHSEMMTEWVSKLDPQADEAQLLAARAHHFRRWVNPRGEYPEGRSGYLRWRTQAKKRQAEEVGALLAGVGYDDGLIARVGSIIRKEHLATDPAVQTHENALCLVFLDTQLDALADKQGDDETVDIIVKTIPKMSQQGLEAIGLLELSDRGAALVGAAVTRRGSE